MRKPEPDSSSGRFFLPLPLGRAGLTVSIDTTAGHTLRAMASKRSPSAPTSACTAAADGLPDGDCWARAGAIKLGDSATAAAPPTPAQAPRKVNMAKRFMRHLPRTWPTHRQDRARGGGSRWERDRPARADEAI